MVIQKMVFDNDQQNRKEKYINSQKYKMIFFFSFQWIAAIL